MCWSEGETAVAPNGKLPELVCESFDRGSRRRCGVPRRACVGSGGGAVWNPPFGLCSDQNEKKVFQNEILLDQNDTLRTIAGWRKIMHSVICGYRWKPVHQTRPSKQKSNGTGMNPRTAADKFFHVKKICAKFSRKIFSRGNFCADFFT